MLKILFKAIHDPLIKERLNNDKTRETLDVLIAQVMQLPFDYHISKNQMSDLLRIKNMEFQDHVTVCSISKSFYTQNSSRHINDNFCRVEVIQSIKTSFATSFASD